MNLITIDNPARSRLQKQKYALILADEFSIAPELTAARQCLWADWNNLMPDNYLKDGSTFRKRRFALFYLLPRTEDLVPFPSTPYFQSSEINSYAGDIARKFARLLDKSLTNPFLHELIKSNFRQFPVDSDLIDEPWEIDVHQFRIIASQDEPGEPTPEGIHHDGDDFNCIHLIARQNVIGGVNSVYDNDCNLLTSCTLRHPMDSMMVWDPYVMHGVTPIHPKNSSQPAYRDVLVIGYNHRPGLERPQDIP
jgi:hypothetical protein